MIYPAEDPLLPYFSPFLNFYVANYKGFQVISSLKSFEIPIYRHQQRADSSI